MDKVKLGYAEALRVTLETISPLGSDRIALSACADRVLAEDMHAKVNSPSIDASMKDGYAVRSVDIGSAAPESPVILNVIGMAAAGTPCPHAVTGGTAVRILTGARIPDGADAVLAEEFATCQGNTLTVVGDAHPGRNILPRGADVAVGELVATQGGRLSPGRLGILAAAGFGELPVYRQPRVAILATGDELVVPGRPLPEGKLYASNLEMLNAWCRRYGMQTRFSILSDAPETIVQRLAEAAADNDAMITSGGAWTGERDFVADALSALKWHRVFQWIRIGPGKAAGFGLLNGKPIFLLPGGPPSNLTAFLQIALPGLLRLGGHQRTDLPRMKVRLDQSITCREIDWTEFVYGTFDDDDGQPVFRPLKGSSRLKSLALAQGVIAVPVGVKTLSAGSMISAQMLL